MVRSTICAIAAGAIVIRPSGEVTSISRVRRARARAWLLDGLENLAALEAARADVGARRLPVQEHADALEVRVEAALRGHHRMAPVVTETRLLPADCTDLRHRAGSVATPQPTAAARRDRPFPTPCAPPRRPCRSVPRPVRACR